MANMFPNYGFNDGLLNVDPLNLASNYQQQVASTPSWYNPINTPSLVDQTKLNYGIPTFNTPNTTNTQQSQGIKWTGKDGVLIPGLNALSNIASAYTGLKQYGLAKDTFNFNKALTQRNLANQAKVTNAAIEDRARGRLSQEGGNIPNLDRLVANQTADRKIKGTL